MRMAKAQPGKALHDAQQTKHQLKHWAAAPHRHKPTSKCQPHMLKKIESRQSTTRATYGTHRTREARDPTRTQARKNETLSHQQAQMWRDPSPSQRHAATKHTPRNTHPLLQQHTPSSSTTDSDPANTPGTSNSIHAQEPDRPRRKKRTGETQDKQRRHGIPGCAPDLVGVTNGPKKGLSAPAHKWHRVKMCSYKDSFHCS
ncbi:Hypothetical predicted protein [Pelobates cultripes]|uniref:Uncharacterized protein n=1 Tax=Pelobates cultripes TaxID=61616 RepID=A0AAD1WJA6_PELCU|nr:Hypothetical predicted protein [Pelobates cultripes]